MNERRARLLAEMLKHLEDLDGEELKKGMQPIEEPPMDSGVDMEMMDVDVVDAPEEGPMEALLEEETDEETTPAPDEDEMDDEELEELMRQNM